MTTSVYDAAGRVMRTQAPDGLWTTNEYYLTGLYLKTSGARVNPVQYTYDYAGRVSTMTTWQDYAGGAGAAATTWQYDGARGFLANKVYATTNGPAYAYTAAGRLARRAWARGVTTTNSYGAAGDLSGVSYSDGTPGVSLSYDRQGRPAQITGATTNDFAYTAAGLLLSENAVNRSWNYASQNRIGYDALQRRNGLTNLSLGLTHTYAYDAASRLQSVGTLDSGAATLAAYSYLNNSPLVSGLTFQQNGATRLTVSEGYDNLNRLRQISSLTNAQALVAFTYAYNLANQRAAVTNADGSSWAYGYDRLGQVTNGWRSWSDGSDVLGQTFNYAFDDIGNRKSAGTGTPGAQRTQTYAVNLLNQYTNRTVPGYLEVNGSADAAASVTVNGGAVSRQGEYYRQEVSVNNSTAALVQWLTSRATNATGTSLVARLSFVAQTPEVSTCDADGNLTQDGLWNYTWDGENRLTRIETRTSAVTDSNYWQRLDATYDYQSRRVRKQVSHWNPSNNSYQLSVSLRFFYDGWNLIGQVDEVTGTRLSFVWGTDLSGAMQGAGGVGGMKALIVHNGSLAGTYFYGYDGNGNAADGSEAARYEYGPFGELLRATGPMAKANPFRFSTKYQDDETGFLYYGYRYYNSSTGSWLSREPLQEAGSLNLMSFVGNNGVNGFDVLGLHNSAGHFYTTYLVARAAGLSDDDAFKLAYWSQYPDQDQSYAAAHNFLNLQWDIGQYLHSLTGGDPSKLRSYLACLLKSGQFTPAEMGLLIHALGDAYSHAYVDMNPTLGSPRGLRPNPHYKHERLYGPGIGHGLAGHTPDFIGHDPANYGNYVDQLYGILSALPNAGEPHPEWVAGLEDRANGFSGPSFSDFFKPEHLNGQEVAALRGLLGGYGESAYKYDPDSKDQPPTLPGMQQDVNFRDTLIDKIKNGVKGCCPKK